MFALLEIYPESRAVPGVSRKTKHRVRGEASALVGDSEISESMRCIVCFDKLSVSFRIIGNEIQFWEYVGVRVTRRATQACREPSCRWQFRSNGRHV